jgi:cobalt/nickel transport system permease protein
MHISDGLLPAEVLVGGFAVTGVCTALSLRGLKDRDIPKTAMITSAFFAASLLHVRLGGTSVHLMLHGLVGVIVGWRAMLPIVVGLTLQALLFQHGGITTIGVNGMLIGGPAMVVGGAFRLANLHRSRAIAMIWGFAAGAGAMVLSLGAFLTIGLVADERFFVAIQAMVVAHLIIAVAEGAVTAAAVRFLSHVDPEMLSNHAESHASNWSGGRDGAGATGGGTSDGRDLPVDRPEGSPD